MKFRLTLYALMIPLGLRGLFHVKNNDSNVLLISLSSTGGVGAIREQKHEQRSFSVGSFSYLLLADGSTFLIN